MDKSSSLPAASGVTKFITMIAMNLVTLCCQRQLKIKSNVYTTVLLAEIRVNFANVRKKFLKKFFISGYSENMSPYRPLSCQPGVDVINLFSS
jgi:hypothetical protein